MATITGPSDAPHGRVTITMERYEAEALGRFAADALDRYAYPDDEARPVVAALVAMERTL
jgi:hypothetical protein